MFKEVLHQYSDPEIKISMEIYFDEAGNLFFDGYDIGPRVKELTGDSDYEYTYTITPIEYAKFCSIFGLRKGAKRRLLQAIKARFHEDDAYSRFGKFMRDHDIEYSSFTWN